MLLASSGKLIWQCESTSITSQLHCVSGSGGLQYPAQQGFDFVARFQSAVFFTELDANALGAVALRDRGDPDDVPYHLQLDRIINQAEQHEHLVTDLEALVGRDKQAAALDERHIGSIQGCFFLDGKGKHARLGSTGDCLGWICGRSIHAASLAQSACGWEYLYILKQEIF